PIENRQSKIPPTSCILPPSIFPEDLMKIHEYQARDILAKAGIPVPPSRVADTPDAAAQAFVDNNAPLQVVKAQVFAGGRGKAGFVQIDKKSREEVREAAHFMLNNKMKSVQTGGEGIPVKKV